MKSQHVLAFSAKPYDQTFLSSAAVAWGDFEFECFDFRLNPISAEMARGYEVVSPFVNDDISEDTLKVLSKGGTKLIALRCAGYNNVDLAAAERLNIKVVNVPSYSPHALAEYAIALMLALSRKIPKACDRVKDGNFSLNGLLGFNFYQKTVGIIGGGKIGQLVGERMKAFGCEILVYEPYNIEACEALGFKCADLDTLITQSDIITLHCPLVPSTRHIINAKTIANMKQGVMLINTGRGGLLDTKAVLAAIKSRKVAYLAIDVYEEESALFFDDHSSDIIQDDIFERLITFPNVIVTGHQGYFTEEALQDICLTTVTNIMQFKNNQVLTNQLIV
ncbi:MAG: D-lactate dehydrogenase [Methylophagaceae bacterium]|jgi:D-lactate dehydrogenase